MKHTRLAVGTLVLALVVLLASPAWAALRTAADWQLNERSGMMIDSSPNHNSATPRHVGRTGSIYVFNGSTSRVVVPDDNSLDPANRNIALTASVRVSGAAMDDDSYDIVRKGLVTTQGGDYKMEIKRESESDPSIGKLHCLFKGDGGTVDKVAKPDIVDGNWHTLACTKTSTAAVARVDGRTYTQRGSAGSISNGKEVLVGAKMTHPFDDAFEGSMDFVRIYIAR
jgi:Concanavalin A-like lectin/glucanases superfamily